MDVSENESSISFMNCFPLLLQLLQGHRDEEVFIKIVQESVSHSFIRVLDLSSNLLEGSIKFPF